LSEKAPEKAPEEAPEEAPADREDEDLLALLDEVEELSEDEVQRRLTAQGVGAGSGPSENGDE
jgi:hypothetical protein